RRSRRRILFGAETSRWVTSNRGEVLRLALERRDSIRSEVSPCEDPSPLPPETQTRLLCARISAAARQSASATSCGRDAPARSRSRTGKAGECPRSDDLRAHRIATYECQLKGLTAIRSDPARGLRAKRALARLTRSEISNVQSS